MVVERKRLKALTSRVVLRWKHGTLSNSFVKWWLELSRMRITERTMAKILRRTLCKAWGRWEDNVDFFGKKEVDFVGEKEVVQACSCNIGECPQCGRHLNQVVDGNVELDPDLQPAEGAFVGLEVTEEPPHHVKKIDDLVDKNFVRWDALGYSNPPIHILDRILQVDGNDAEHASLSTLHGMLSGALHTTVLLSMARSQTDERYSVVALRHGFHTFEKFKASSSAQAQAQPGPIQNRQKSDSLTPASLHTSQRSGTAGDLYHSQQSARSAHSDLNSSAPKFLF